MSKIFEALQRAQRDAAASAAAAGATGQPARNAGPGSVVAEAVIPAAAAVAEASGPGVETPPPAEPPAPVAEPAPIEPAAPPAPLLSAGAKAIVALDPASPAAEQYRVLRTNILKLREALKLKVVLVGSPGPGDGKTLTALNLAISFGQKPDTRVLLIEGDMRKAGLSTLIGLEDQPGLTNYLAGEGEMEQMLHCIAPSVFLLCSGPPVDTAANLLHSPRVDVLFEEARRQFDWVIVDGPPINMLADHELLAQHSDGVLLIVRPLHTSRELLRLALQSVQTEKILGVVVNATPLSRRYSGYYGYGYGYGYGSKRRPAGDATKVSKDQPAKTAHKPG